MKNSQIGRLKQENAFSHFAKCENEEKRRMMPNLSPTLWRTCRALANRKRLALLRQVIVQEPVSVEDLALRAKISVGTCSQWLRLLNSRGLLRVVRQGRWVYYSLGADSSVRQAEGVLNAIRKALQVCKNLENEEHIFHALTAYTHPRRIQIVKAVVAAGEISVQGLSQALRISIPALYRHLHKLEDRSLISMADDRCRITQPRSGFARTLFHLAINE
jgi:DNA-binding transcriptional ArsR family regulator